MPTRAPRRSSALRSAISTVLAVVFTVVVMLAAVLSVASHLSARNQYTVFGHPVLSVLSGSMSPAIHTGDLIVDDEVNAAQAKSLHVGQIITFRSPTDADKFFTHRIYAVHTNAQGVSYVTKGDANNAPDAVAVPASNVIGVYNTKIRFGGYMLSVLHDPIVLALLIGAVLLWVVADPLRRRIRSNYSMRSVSSRSEDSIPADADPSPAHRRARHALTN
jgi:signal peptidase I